MNSGHLERMLEEEKDKVELNIFTVTSVCYTSLEALQRFK